jgi:hypothetical protein
MIILAFVEDHLLRHRMAQAAAAATRPSRERLPTQQYLFTSKLASPCPFKSTSCVSMSQSSSTSTVP